MGPPRQFALNKTPPARPNIGLTICLTYALLFPLGFRSLRVIFILAPPGQFSFECWSKPSDVRRPLGNQGLCQPEVLLIRCALRPRYVQLLSGFVGTSGGFAGLVLLLSKCLVAGNPRLIGSSRGEGISFVDRESLSWAKLGHPCRV